MKISVVLATAKDSYPAHSVPGPHIFDFALASLEKQKFTDFELIIVDALYDTRKDFFSIKNYTFPIKHIPPKPSIWHDKGMWAVCNARNTGIIRADGQLVVFIDDCISFDENFLSLFWNHYATKGCFALAVYDYLDADGGIAVEAGKVVEDSRKHTLTHDKECTIHQGNWYYTGAASASLDALFEINGFDENFDGTKSLEDCDLGTRLALAGYKFILDRGLVANIHVVVYDIATYLTYKGLDFKSNYPLMLINESRPRIRANSDVLTEKEIQFVREKNDGVKTIEDIFSLWKANQPRFDLRLLSEATQ